MTVLPERCSYYSCTIYNPYDLLEISLYIEELCHHLHIQLFYFLAITLPPNHTKQMRDSISTVMESFALRD